MQNIETPFLVNVSVTSFKEYISSLATTGKKNYRYVEKNNEDLTYSIINYDENLVSFFMKLWEEQLIRGEKKKWGFPPSYVTYLNNLGLIELFVTYDKELNVIALHFVEKHDDYIYCHPPLYDKNTSNKRYIAKYMWFNLIKYYIEQPKINWIDFGAGNRGTWKELLINREEYMEKMAYKWLYVPKYVKQNPTEELDYIVIKNPPQRKLILK
tara:strand:+ start:1905 stop:2540 length:636 start_codon:yes stop_codon:yes gene_type:complete